MNVSFNPRIVGALILGAVLISGSFWLNLNIGSQKEGNLTTANTNNETDGTGYELYDQANLINPNWEDVLGLNVTNSATAVATYTPPTTLTGQYGVHLLQQIMESNMEEQGRSVSEIVSESLAELDKATADRKFTFSDLKTTKDVSLPTLKQYGNSVTEITLNYSSPYKTIGDPLEIYEAAQTSGNEEDLASLDNHIEYYEAVLKDTRELVVPIIYQGTHLEILNAYVAHLNDLRALRASFDDPLLTIARLRNYVPNLEAIYNAYNKLYAQMHLNGVRWNESDVVSQFLRFEN